MEVKNPSSSSVTHEDVEAIQAFESTDVSHTSVKDNTDYNFLGLGCFLMYRLTMGQARKTNQKIFVLLFFKMLVMMLPGLRSFSIYHLTIRQV